MFIYTSQGKKKISEILISRTLLSVKHQSDHRFTIFFTFIKQMFILYLNLILYKHLLVNVLLCVLIKNEIVKLALISSQIGLLFQKEKIRTIWFTNIFLVCKFKMRTTVYISGYFNIIDTITQNHTLFFKNDFLNL